MKLALGILLFLASGAIAQLPDVPVVDLADLAEQRATLPLMAEEATGLSTSPVWMGRMAGNPWVVADLDDDGNDDFLISRQDYVLISTIDSGGFRLTHDQVNFSRQYMGRAAPHGPMGTGFALAGPFDLDGDGNLEIMAWGTTEDYRTWGFWVVEILKVDGRFTLVQESEFTLHNQPERLVDDRWDGRYSVVGAVPGLLGDPARLALIVTVNVERDLQGRGVMAVDPYSGEILWYFHCGTNPTPLAFQVVDLEGDGPPELVFAAGGPGNLHGEMFGGYSDHQTRLFVLDSLTGQEKWSRRLCGERSCGHLAIGDIDTAPGLELISSYMVAGLQETEIRVWSSAGDLIASREIPESSTGLRLISGEQNAVPAVYLSTMNGSLWRLDWIESGLAPTRRAQFNNGVYFSPSSLFDDQDHSLLVLQDNFGTGHILDQDFHPLASFEGKGIDYPSLRTGNSQFFFGIGYDQIFGWQIKTNPNALPANPALRFLATVPPLGWALLALAAVPFLIWWLLARKHRQQIRARAVIPGDSDHLREARLHLLEDLELSGHGAIAPLRSLRRLLWLLDAVKTGIEFNFEMSARFREIWTDCHQDDLPRLLVILDRARAADLSHPSIETATSALEKIQTHLADLKERDFEPERIIASGESLHQAGDAAEAALQSLRREVADLFTADLEETLKKVLRANEETISAAGVEVATGLAATAADGQSAGAPASAEPLGCRIDPTELGFILDNLVGNAVRAMSGAAKRRLRVTWLPTNGMIKMEVSDTGVGIAAEDRDQILDTPFTTKERGGLGLFRSSRILRKYGGQLTVKSSAPGRGTTFQLLLPRSRN
jgi:signal transduction histidine kinase